MTTKTDAARESNAAKAVKCAEEIYYQPQERAFAPGIVKEWPSVIPHPTDPNGRLVKMHFPPSVPVSRLSKLLDDAYRWHWDETDYYKAIYALITEARSHE